MHADCVDGLGHKRGKRNNNVYLKRFCVLTPGYIDTPVGTKAELERDPVENIFDGEKP